MRQSKLPLYLNSLPFAIRNTLDLDSAKMAAHAFVTSTLDYGLPYTKLRKLQIVQNASARVLIQTKNQYVCC